MNELKIIIDNRENSLIKVIKQKKPKLRSLLEINNLPVGDILISDKDDKIILVIERKTWTDLSKSITDGRYRNQKDRLISFSLNNNLRRDQIMYLIEGEYGERKGKLLYTTLKSACVNLQIRDGFRIYFTESIDDTALFIEKIINCLYKYQPYSIDIINNNNESNQNNFYKSLSIVKKDNLTPEITYMNQLAIIPGLSIKKVQSIISIYPNWITLINALNNSNNGDILKNCKGIGQVLSEKIYRYIIIPSNSS